MASRLPRSSLQLGGQACPLLSGSYVRCSASPGRQHSVVRLGRLVHPLKVSTRLRRVSFGLLSRELVREFTQASAQCRPDRWGRSFTQARLRRVFGRSVGSWARSSAATVSSPVPYGTVGSLAPRGLDWLLRCYGLGCASGLRTFEASLVLSSLSTQPSLPSLGFRLCPHSPSPTHLPPFLNSPTPRFRSLTPPPTLPALRFRLRSPSHSLSRQQTSLHSPPPGLALSGVHSPPEPPSTVLSPRFRTAALSLAAKQLPSLPSSLKLPPSQSRDQSLGLW